MSNPYVTLLVGSLNSTTVPPHCLVHKLKFLRSANIWHGGERRSLILHPCFWISTMQIFSPPLFPFSSGFFFIKHVHVNCKFHFLLCHRMISKHACSGLGCAHSILRVFFLHQPDSRGKGRLNCNSCP